MRFSVVIPVYNRYQYARQAIDSVLSQSFKNYELIVVDDGSADKTAAVLSSYGSCIQILRQTNQGAEVARYKAASQARGEYIVFLDSDDLLCTHALETYNHVIRECGSPPLLIAAKISFQDGDPIPEEVTAKIGAGEAAIFPDFLSRNVSMFLSSSVIVIRKSAFEEIGGPRSDSSSKLILDDFHMCLKVGTQSPCVVIHKPITVAYREHSSNAHKNLRANVRAIISLIEHERSGQYPGGRERQKERYVWIGSIGLHWVRNWLKAAKPEYMFQLLPRGTPMLAIATLRKINRGSGICSPNRCSS